MKKLLLLSLVGFSFAAQAQQILSGLAAEKILPAAQQIMFNGRTNAPAFIRLKPAEQVAYTEFDSWARKALKMGAADGLSLYKVGKKDHLGFINYRYEQTFNGVPVEYATYIVHTKDGKIVSVNGDFNQNIDIDNILILTESIAKDKAMKAYGVKTLMADVPGFTEDMRKMAKDPSLDYHPKGRLMILPIGEGSARTFRYAYKFDLFSALPYGRWEVYVDAATGKVIESNNLIADADVTATAKTKYSGEQKIVTDSIANPTDTMKYRLYEDNHFYKDTSGAIVSSGVSISTRNAKNLQESQAPGNYSEFYDNDNYWNNKNNNFDEAATDAHWGAESTYDYFKNLHDRNSYDDKGGPFISYVHIREKSYFNASWNGVFMVYGDAGGTPLTAIDICGHELAHGVTGNTARLIYQRESGGLNESFSDIFGNTIQWYAKKDKFDWRVGEDAATLRSMSSPNTFGDPDTYMGTNWKDASSSCIPNSNTNDNCGVHSNSGVQNFWYYLLVTGGTGKNDLGNDYAVTGIGFPKASRIAYRNLDGYLTQSSGYKDAAFFATQAAMDEFGEDSQEMISTINAWYAVGVGKKYSAIPVAEFDIVKPVCVANGSIKFLNSSSSNATEYIWNFGDGTATSSSREPSHSYDAAGSYTVTLIAKNTNGADTMTRTKFINIFNDAPTAATCTPETSNPTGTVGVLGFKLNDINNVSDGASKGGQYEDFTCTRTKLKPGSLYTITITTNKTAQYTRVWVDYNNDNNFSADELAFKTDNVVETHTGPFMIPTTAVQNKPLRVRVIAARASGNTPDDACANLKGGQVEEYVIYADPTAVNAIEELKGAADFSIFPNPSNGILNISFAAENKSATKVTVMNALGDVVMSTDVKPLANEPVSIDMSTMAKGMYYVKVTSGNSSQVQKLILQ